MLRHWKEGDLRQMAAIENATQAAPWTHTIFKDCYRAGYSGWVFEQEEKLIGFLILSLRDNETHLLNIAIHPHFQHRGFGTQLIQHALAMAKQVGAQIIYLEVRESNQHAIKLYQKMGFMHVGTRENYYPALNGRENGLIYARKLSDLRPSREA